jgi:hypothetical protein
VSNQAGALQDAQVLGHGRPADRHVPGELGDRSRPLADEREDLPAVRIGEGQERGFVSVH